MTVAKTLCTLHAALVALAPCFLPRVDGERAQVQHPGYDRKINVEVRFRKGSKRISFSLDPTRSRIDSRLLNA